LAWRIGNPAQSRASGPQFHDFLFYREKRIGQSDRQKCRICDAVLRAIAPTPSRVNLDHLFFIAMPSRAAFVIHWLGFIGWDFRRSGSLCEWYKFENSDRGSAKQDGLAGWWVLLPLGS
jgi:hypothetical protein